MKEMVGGCCVCSDDRGWTENPLVYCDGPGCTVAVHQACYGIVTVPLGNWYCRKCESADVNTKVRCELCPNKDGALKPTDNNAWAHVVCALYIPEVRFGNVSTMEPIILEQIPPERYHKTCYLCEENSRGSGRASVGACMSCNKPGCKVQFHVTCAQSRGLLCEEAGAYMDNVKYCGYCHHHYTKIVIKKKGVNVKVIPPYKPVTAGSASPESEGMKATSKRKISTPPTKTSTGKSASASSVSPALEEGPKTDDSAPSGAPDGVPQPPKSPVAPATDAKRKRKGETRTPSATGLTPDGSPRPITPSGASTSGASSSAGQRAPTPSSSPSLGTAGQGQNPGTSSRAMSPSEPKRPLIQGVLKDNQRPNSIVVNVPLDVATSVANIPALQPSVNLGVPTTLGVTGTTTLPQLDMAGLVSSGTSQSSGAPLKRSRSQSSEKTDKPRRSSKRSGAGNSSGPGNKPLTGSSPTLPTTNVPNSNKTDGASSSHLANHLGGEPPHSGSGKTRRHSQSHSSGHASNHASGHAPNHSSGHHTGHSSGHNPGHHTGHSSGHNPGHSSGHNPGHSSGHNPNHTSGHNPNHTSGHSSGHAVSHSAHATNHPSGHAPNHPPGHAPAHASGHAPNHSSGHSTNHISHTSTNHLSHQQPGGSASTTPAGAPPMNHIHVVPSPSPPQVKDDKTDIKLLPTAETVQAPHMLGNRLNPSSTMAQKMCDTLSQEMVAHSVFSTETATSNHHIGPQITGRGSSSTPATTVNHTPGGGGWGGSSSVPQSLEQLLERQWEQGSQFLMEQAQHFDIASLLTCLHQLRAENSTLEEQVSQLVQRRDHLLAVNARLAIPLVPTVATTSSTVNPQNGNPIAAQQVTGQQSGPIVENGLPNSSPQDIAAFRSSTIRQNSSNPSNISGINNPNSAQNSVLVRTSAADSRRSSHSPAANVYNPNPMFQQNQQQVVMRRDVIEMNQSGSSKAS